jgi:hypothetical protein
MLLATEKIAVVRWYNTSCGFTSALPHGSARLDFFWVRFQWRLWPFADFRRHGMTARRFEEIKMYAPLCIGDTGRNVSKAHWGQFKGALGS